MKVTLTMLPPWHSSVLFEMTISSYISKLTLLVAGHAQRSPEIVFVMVYLPGLARLGENVRASRLSASLAGLQVSVPKSWADSCIGEPERQKLSTWVSVAFISRAKLTVTLASPEHVSLPM